VNLRIQDWLKTAKISVFKIVSSKRRKQLLKLQPMKAKEAKEGKELHLQKLQKRILKQQPKMQKEKEIRKISSRLKRRKLRSCD